MILSIISWAYLPTTKIVFGEISAYIFAFLLFCLVSYQWILKVLYIGWIQIHYHYMLLEYFGPVCGLFSPSLFMTLGSISELYSVHWSICLSLHQGHILHSPLISQTLKFYKNVYIHYFVLPILFEIYVINVFNPQCTIVGNEALRLRDFLKLA